MVTKVMGRLFLFIKNENYHMNQMKILFIKPINAETSSFFPATVKCGFVFSTLN